MSDTPRGEHNRHLFPADLGAPFNSGGAFSSDKPVEYIRDSMFVRKPSVRGEVKPDADQNRASGQNRDKFFRD
jgi:hypothetical protein